MGGTDEDPALYFELYDTDVHLRCPDCFEVLWLTSDEARTLGDVVRVANEHKCETDAATAAGKD